MVKASYIYFRKGEKIDKTIPIYEGVYLDLSIDGKIIGIEILE